LLGARAAVLHDLAARGYGGPLEVDVVEDALVARRWWVASWPAGAAFLAGQVAQDVQERLRDDHEQSWPVCAAQECPAPEVHELHIDPDLGPDPHWVCQTSGIRVARLGTLSG